MRDSRRRRPLLALVPFIIACAACAGDGTTEPSDDDDEDARPYVLGVAVSPRGFPVDYSAIEVFYAEIGGWPEPGGVMWNGAWRDDVAGGTDAGQIPGSAIANMVAADRFGTIPLNVIGWRSGEQVWLGTPTNPVSDWTNDDAKTRFRAMLVAFAQQYRPPYLFVGNENSAYYEQDPADYARWVAFYEDAYDAVKAVSPTTLMGTVFNYEHLSGNGSLTGFDEAMWGALDAHDLSKIDVLGVTLYPFLDAASPAEVPADYLAPLRAHIGTTPIAITETGWPAEAIGELPWAATPQAQLEFLPKLRMVLAGFDVRWVNWLFLHEMSDPGGSPTDWRVFGSISLKDGDGAERPIHDAWLEFDPRD